MKHILEWCNYETTCEVKRPVQSITLKSINRQTSARKKITKYYVFPVLLIAPFRHLQQQKGTAIETFVAIEFNGRAKLIVIYSYSQALCANSARTHNHCSSYYAMARHHHHYPSRVWIHQSASMSAARCVMLCNERTRSHKYHSADHGWFFASVWISVSFNGSAHTS